MEAFLDNIFENIYSYGFTIGIVLVVLLPAIVRLYQYVVVLLKKPAEIKRAKLEDERQVHETRLEQLARRLSEAEEELGKEAETKRAELEAEKRVQEERAKQLTRKLAEIEQAEQEAKADPVLILLSLEADSRESNGDKLESLMKELKELSTKNIRTIMENDEDKKVLFNKILEHARSTGKSK